MDVELVDDPRRFLAEAGPLLLADEARHNLALGIAGTLRDHPGHYPEHRLWLVRDGGEVVGAALRTPPHGLVLARPRDEPALAALAEAIDDDLPGVIAARPEAEAFAAAWTAKTGRPSRLRFAQGIFRLERVVPASAHGAMRHATVADRELLLDWWRAFLVEAEHDPDPNERAVARTVDQRLAAEGESIALWQEGDPVAFACASGATPNGIRIGPVYTPPALRGRGYASALVAQLSAAQLAAGRRFCFLYTDLANPTANRIYERIGYERVCEGASLEFVRPRR